LSPFSATIVQNSSNPRNDWNFTLIRCAAAAMPAGGGSGDARNFRLQMP
jgi:hypothetical protein